ncbi:MAG TPA: DUF2231 domain-containing protein [Gemmatimonadaceae bacterium]|nr:DUF2231 domain-containing protein [Gemmatimonadaceae bacterium]
MHSTARVGTHPIHPMLIPFPFALWLASFAADLYAAVRDQFHYFGYYLAWAGCIMAVVAAIPGAIDLFTAVPAGSAARRTGIRHALLNVSALVLFAISIAVRPGPDYMNYAAYATAGLGTILVLIAGWLGGSLVYDHKVGVPE